MRPEDIELRDLRYFVAVAEELHFGKAAARVSLAQPSLSKAIQRLEQQLDVKLFHRSTRQVELTDAGAMFLDGARRTIAEAKNAARRAQLAATGHVGILSVGFVGSATYDILPALLRQFRDDYPQVVLELHELNTTSQIHALQTGVIDVGLVRPPVWDETLEQVPLFEEPFVIGVPGDHPLAGPSDPVSLDVLADEELVLFRRGITPGFFDTVIELMHEAGFDPNIVHECTSFASIIALVSGGMGVSLLPRSLTPHLERLGGVVRELDDQEALARWAVVWSPSHQADRANLKEFVSVAQDMAADVLAGSSSGSA